MGDAEQGMVRRRKRWTSPLRIAGLPLVDVHFADTERGIPEGEKKPRGRALGWIAVGDVATGVIAIGMTARGIVALGALSIGVFSIGGLSLGLISIGGLAAGVLAMGGGAIGWNAAGGLAIGLHAAGGVAVAWYVAAGGAAFAHDFAVGGVSVGAETDTALAQRVAERDTMLLPLLWLVRNQGLASLVIVGALVLPLIAALRIKSVTKQ